MNPHFCALPWVHVHIGQGGHVLPCCMALPHVFQDESGPLDAGRRPVRELWNAAPFREMRQMMMRGEAAPACEVCWQEEALGRASMRLSKTKYWTVQHADREAVLDRVRRTSVDGTVADSPMSYDLRPGNVCNLRCRMCSAEWSNQIAADPVHGRWSPALTLAGVVPGREWYADPEALVDRVIGDLEGVRQVHFTGGEPFLVPAVRRAVGRLAESGCADRIRLAFHSNLTVLPDALLDLLRRFQQVRIGASIDAVGPEYEYIRHGAKWDVVSANFARLAREPGIDLYCQPTLQILNALSLVPLLDHCEGLGVPVHINTLMHPDHMSAQFLPAAAKERAAERLQAFAARSRLARERPRFAKRIEALVARFGKRPGKDLIAARLGAFARFTNDLDVTRGERLRDVMPELHGLIAAQLGGWPEETVHAALGRRAG